MTKHILQGAFYGVLIIAIVVVFTLGAVGLGYIPADDGSLISQFVRWVASPVIALQ
jgi:hypothetical protein